MRRLASRLGLLTHGPDLLVCSQDVEGMRAGIEESLVRCLGEWSPIRCTYAGGVRSLEDVDLVHRLGGGRVDVSIGSALDIFGGALSMELVARHVAHLRGEPASESVVSVTPA